MDKLFHAAERALMLRRFGLQSCKVVGLICAVEDALLFQFAAAPKLEGSKP